MQLFCSHHNITWPDLARASPRRKGSISIYRGQMAECDPQQAPSLHYTNTHTHTHVADTHATTNTHRTDRQYVHNSSTLGALAACSVHLHLWQQRGKGAVGSGSSMQQWWSGWELCEGTTQAGTGRKKPTCWHGSSTTATAQASLAPAPAAAHAQNVQCTCSLYYACTLCRSRTVEVAAPTCGPTAAQPPPRPPLS